MRWAALSVLAFLACGASASAIVPQGITKAEMERYDLYGVGCAFNVPRKADFLALADDDGAEIKLRGGLVRLAPDPRSPELAYLTRARYANSTYVLRFAKIARRPSAVGSESEDWPATMTITDPGGRVLFSARGTLSCGA